MAVVYLRGQLRKLASDQAEIVLDAPTVLELLRALELEHPALAGWVIDERGRIRRHINVFVKAERADEKSPVAESDRVDVIPAISGGSS